MFARRLPTRTEIPSPAPRSRVPATNSPTIAPITDKPAATRRPVMIFGNADGNFNPAASKAVHGGDFKGIEQKLDYIKSLGATAIWISPVVKNTAGQYHGYLARDFYNRHEVAAQSGKTNGARISFEQLDSDLVVD